MKDVAKVVWRWSSLIPQIVDDFRYHRTMRDCGTPLPRRFFEQLGLLWTNRIRAADYYAFGLSDPAMPAAMKRCYVGLYEVWRVHYAYNPKEFRDLTEKKLQFHAYAAKANLPTSEILALVTQKPDGHAFPCLGTADELRGWMVENAIADVVVKPVDGTKGWGLLSLGKRLDDLPRWEKLPSREPIDFPALWEHCARYLYRGGVIIERRLAPHPVLANLVPDVLHTIRAVTYLQPEPVIIDMVLRVGNGRTPADNMAQGGIVVPIDVATGRCGQGTLLIDGIPKRIDEHPLSGSRITGIELPCWDQVCDLARTAAQAFPMQKSIGWDIGLTPAGPILLEGNSTYDLSVNQLANRKGMLATRWVEVFNNEGAYRHLGLGFVNPPR